MAEAFRMPDGKTTCSVDRYIKAWNALTAPAVEQLGLLVIGFDPHVSFHCKRNPQAAVQMPVWLLKRINDALRKEVGGAV